MSEQIPDFNKLIPDVSQLPFESQQTDWINISDFPTTEDMLRYLAGDQLGGDVFFVEVRLIGQLAAEHNIHTSEVTASMTTVLPRWVRNQRMVTGDLKPGQMIESTLAGSQIKFQIGRTEQGFWVHLPR